MLHKNNWEERNEGGKGICWVGDEIWGHPHMCVREVLGQRWIIGGVLARGKWSSRSDHDSWWLCIGISMSSIFMEQSHTLKSEYG